MKKSIITIFVLFVIGFGFKAQAQKFSDPDPSPLDVAYYPDGLPLNDLRARTTTAPKIKLYYSRPQLKGREMLGAAAAPFGQIWRLGANEANEITFYQDVTFGGTQVSKGTYSLFAIPNKDKWTFVLHSKLNTWGNYALQDSKEIARADAKLSKSEQPIEYLSMMFKKAEDGAHLLVGWQNTIAELPIKF